MPFTVKLCPRSLLTLPTLSLNQLWDFSLWCCALYLFLHFLETKPLSGISVTISYLFRLHSSHSDSNKTHFLFRPDFFQGLFSSTATYTHDHVFNSPVYFLILFPPNPTQVAVPVFSVRLVKKHKTAGLVPNGLAITTDTGQKVHTSTSVALDPNTYSDWCGVDVFSRGAVMEKVAPCYR